MEKVKMQMLADSLGISRVTVWKVLNDRKGVSPKTQTLVREALKKRQQESLISNLPKRAIGDAIKSISLIASRTETSGFWMSIVDQIVSEANARSVRLNYIPVDVMGVSAQQLKEMLSPEQTDGVIVVNLYNEELILMLSELELPKVFLDTTPEHDVSDLKGDVISLEGERIIEKVTQSMIDAGCKSIGFIGDINYAKTNALRFKGFEKALSKNNLPLEQQYCMIGKIEKDSYKKEIGEFLDGLSSMPDAFVCVNDYVAFIVNNLLSDKNSNLPRPVLSGYDNSQEFMLDHYNITTVAVDSRMLGKRMAIQIFYRIENPNADFEEILITSKILFRSN